MILPARLCKVLGGDGRWAPPILWNLVLLAKRGEVGQVGDRNDDDGALALDIAGVPNDGHWLPQEIFVDVGKIGRNDVAIHIVGTDRCRIARCDRLDQSVGVAEGIDLLGSAVNLEIPWL